MTPDESQLLNHLGKALIISIIKMVTTTLFYGTSFNSHPAEIADYFTTSGVFILLLYILTATIMFVHAQYLVHAQISLQLTDIGDSYLDQDGQLSLWLSVASSLQPFLGLLPWQYL